MTLPDATIGRDERVALDGMTINPATDRLFTTAVRRAADASRSLAELEARLRRFFPRVRIHAQISDGRGIPTWFIYRDGTWANDPPARLRRRLAVPVHAAMRAGIAMERAPGSGVTSPREPARR